MDWIKKNYDRFTLGVFALGLVAVSAMMFLNTSGFAERFSAALANPGHNNTIPAVDTAVIDQAKQQLENPTIWKVREPNREHPEGDQNGGLLFTPDRFIKMAEGLKKPGNIALYKHSRFQEKFIPNQWLIDHGYNVLDDKITVLDSDGDGFRNEDEWLYGTDPNKKESHPPYHVLLFLKQLIKVKFRLKFQAYDGDIHTPEKMEFQINALDLHQPTEFLKIGDTVAKTKFKLKKFEFKEVLNPKTEEKEDRSELTVENTETGDNVVLILDTIVDSPNLFAAFEYYLVSKDVSDGVKPFEFTVPRLKEFVLRPEITARYKLLDVTDTEAVIQLPDGTTKYTVLKYPGKPPQ